MSVSDKDNHDKRGEIAPQERDAFKTRSDELGRRLEEAKQRTGSAGAAARSKAGSDRGTAMARAMRVSAELLGGVLVGGAIGWFLDGWLGNKRPWFFILFFLLGAAAGILNVVRMAMRERAPPPPSDPGERDEVSKSGPNR